MHSMAARRRKTKKERDRPRVVERTTSTGDLGYGVTLPLLHSPIVKSLVNKKNLINPPFTHGMSGEARNNRLNPIREKVRPPSNPTAHSAPVYTAITSH